MRQVFLAVIMAGTVFAGDLLVRVEHGTGRNVADVAAVGAPVLMVLDGWSIVRAGDGDLVRLGQAGFDPEVLGEFEPGREYRYVMTAAGFDRSRLVEFGDLLAEDARGVVLATDPAGVRGLNRLPVELAGFGAEPLAPRATRVPPRSAAVPDSLVWQLVGRVDEESTAAVFLRLRQFLTRYSDTDSARSALEWVRGRFADYGCSTYLDTFRADYAPSAVGVKRGTVNDRAVFVVCGHVDATSEIPDELTPGSDDNASGAGAVLELCRVTRDMAFDNTVWFVGFSGEEQGLVGSDSFARHAAERGDSIVLAINFDMVSYGREGLDSIEIYGATVAPNSEEWVDFFIAHADTFSGLKHRKVMETSPAPRSDHYSFWKHGFPAIRGGYYDRTPMYHTTGDTIGPMYYRWCGTNNLPMHAEVVKALVASVARMAGAHPLVGVAEEWPAMRPRRFVVTPTVGPGPFRIVSPTAGVGVFEASGRRVRTLVSGDCWDGRGEAGERLSPGVYFLREEGPAGGPAGCASRIPGSGGPRVRKIIVQR